MHSSNLYCTISAEKCTVKVNLRRTSNIKSLLKQKRLLTQLNSPFLIHSDLAHHQSRGEEMCVCVCVRVRERRSKKEADTLWVSNMRAGSYRWYGNCLCERCLEVFWQQRETSLYADSPGPATGTKVCSLQMHKGFVVSTRTKLWLWHCDSEVSVKIKKKKKKDVSEIQSARGSCDAFSFGLTNCILCLYKH